jgi:hypothetical protein
MIIVAPMPDAHPGCRTGWWAWPIRMRRDHRDHAGHLVDINSNKETSQWIIVPLAGMA